MCIGWRGRFGVYRLEGMIWVVVVGGTISCVVVGGPGWVVVVGGVLFGLGRSGGTIWFVSVRGEELVCGCWGADFGVTRLAAMTLC